MSETIPQNWHGEVIFRSIDKERLLNEKVWDVIEHEVKMAPKGNASGDLRPIMREIDLSSDGIVNEQSVKEKTVFTRTVTCQMPNTTRSGVYIIGSAEKPKKMQVKTKIRLPVDPLLRDIPGAVSRKEQIQGLDEVTLQEAFNRVGIVEDITSELVVALKEGKENIQVGPFRISPYYQRQRVKKQYLNLVSGGVVSVIADHCVASDSRPTLDQIEFEFDGSLSNPLFDRERLMKLHALDYKFLVDFVGSKFANRGVKLNPDLRTKMAWITAELNH